MAPAGVALRYRVSVAQVAGWNNTQAGAGFKPGQAVVVMLAPGKANAKPGLRVAAKGAAGTGRKPARPSASTRTHVAHS